MSNNYTIGLLRPLHRNLPIRVRLNWTLPEWEIIQSNYHDPILSSNTMCVCAIFPPFIDCDVHGERAAILSDWQKFTVRNSIIHFPFFFWHNWRKQNSPVQKILEMILGKERKDKHAKNLAWSSLPLATSFGNQFSIWPRHLIASIVFLRRSYLHFICMQWKVMAFRARVFYVESLAFFAVMGLCTCFPNPQLKSYGMVALLSL